ncbi:MAG: glycosyl hydrolase 115 family protein [Clostridia bacterium]|nr:glycosyl hydrolase 115 family protein [Clostridia bacterium]
MSDFVFSLSTKLIIPEQPGRRMTPIRRAAAMLRRDMAAVLTDRAQDNEIRLIRDESLAPEAWQMTVAPDAVTLRCADDLGAAYGLIHLSADALGVDPFWFFNDQPMKQTGTVSIPCGDTDSPRYAVRYRGWFINDEVLLHAWSLDGSKDKPWEMAFEALLRLGGNLVVPGTDSNAHKYHDLAASYGLYITHHHAEPLGAVMFRRAYPELNPAYSEHPDLFEGLWREAIELQKDTNTVYNLGFRGQGDCPFWADDPSYDTPQARGALISCLIRRQYDMVQEIVPGAPCCTNLYGEVMELCRDGYIDLPDEIIRIWADNGFGKMVSRRQNNHNPRVPALPAPGDSAAHGLYYHASFYDLQAASHMTMLPNPPSFVRSELTKALAHGVKDYWIINCSNIKPHVYTLDFIAALWRDGDADPQAHLAAYCTRAYGPENAEKAAACIRSYYDHAVFYGGHEDDRAGEQFANHCARMLVSQYIRNANEPADGMRWAIDAPTLSEQILWYRAKCEQAAAGYSELLRECEAALTGMTGPGRTLFEDSIMMQARLLARTYEGSLLAMDSLLAAIEEDWLNAFILAGRSRTAYFAADRAMREREHGKWRLFYANDCQADVKQSAWMMGVLMGVLRVHGDGPHYYQWQRQFTDSPDNAGIMLLLNTENHMDNDELFAVIQARTDQ